MKASKQTGFSIVEVLIAIVVIAVLAGAGWLVYERVKPTTTKSNTTSNQNQSTNQHNANTGNQQTTGNTFKIPELGVELTLPDSIKDLKYAVDTTTVAGTTSVRFTTATLEAKDGTGSQCTATQSALGVMWKSASNPADTGAAATASKQVGDAYILYNRAQQGCSSNTSTTDLQSSQAKLLEAAVQTARAM